MASKSTGPRQPLEQLKELEKDGRIRRFLCHVLILRVFAYIAAQPASFFFILSLMVITVSMPPVALHVRNTGSLPDLDAMRSWNAYLGNLPSKKLCISEHPSETKWNSSASSFLTPASAFLDFFVDTKAYKSNSTAFQLFTGSQLKTKIKDSSIGRRIDDRVEIQVFLDMSEPENNCSSSECKVRGCVDIRAPLTATPTRRPQIPHTDFTFKTKVLNSANKPEMSTGGKSCSEHYHEQLLLLEVWGLSLGQGCHEVQPMREKYRRHGLINIYLTQVQKEEVYHRVLIGTVGMAAIGLAFAMGIACTDRPPKPKTSAE